MLSGVRKSGLPMPRLTMFLPCACSALARARTSKADSVPRRKRRAASCKALFSFGCARDTGWLLVGTEEINGASAAAPIRAPARRLEAAVDHERRHRRPRQ